MSIIQEQIKALQRKMAKIEEYRAIQSELDKRPEHPEHADLKVEIITPLKEFIDSKISELETGNEVKKPSMSVSGPLSTDEISLIRGLITRIAEREIAPANSPMDVPPQAPKPRAIQLDPNDPLRFLQKHKHFDSKRVSFNTKDGPVTGRVVGLVAPNILVKTDTGYEIPVSPENLQIIAGGKQ